MVDLTIRRPSSLMLLSAISDTAGHQESVPWWLFGVLGWVGKKMFVDFCVSCNIGGNDPILIVSNGLVQMPTRLLNEYFFKPQYVPFASIQRPGYSQSISLCFD